MLRLLIVVLLLFLVASIYMASKTNAVQLLCWCVAAVAVLMTIRLEPND